MVHEADCVCNQCDDTDKLWADLCAMNAKPLPQLMARIEIPVLHVIAEFDLNAPDGIEHMVRYVHAAWLNQPTQ